VLMQSMLMKIMVYEKFLCAFHSHLLSIINLSRCRPYLNIILHYVSLELHIAFQLMQKLVTLWLEFHAERSTDDYGSRRPKERKRGRILE
jgi:hypothetical protein